MSNLVYAWYAGFKTKHTVREYSFLVENGEEEPREFRLTIADETLVSHDAQHRDGPVICAHRLQRELAGASNPPAATHYAITGDELDRYRAASSQK